MNRKEVFAIVVIFLCLIAIVVTVIHFQAPFQYQTSQTENQESTQGNLKTRREFIVKATKDTKKIEALLKVGFEYVCQQDGLIFFRKRK